MGHDKNELAKGWIILPSLSLKVVALVFISHSTSIFIMLHRRFECGAKPCLYVHVLVLYIGDEYVLLRYLKH